MVNMGPHEEGLGEGCTEREEISSWRNTQSSHFLSDLSEGNFETDCLKLRVKEVLSHLNFIDMIGVQSSQSTMA